jgi:hypothetical protein
MLSVPYTESGIIFTFYANNSLAAIRTRTTEFSSDKHLCDFIIAITCDVGARDYCQK